MNVVSFFAGCGGLDLGFEKAGFRVIWANDVEPHCRATYIRNHPNTEFVLGDICKIDPNIIPDCDGFIGGPPCQSWSVGGLQKGLEDVRGQLFLKYIELIGTKKPKFFVIENVKGLLDDRFRGVFNDFLKQLNAVGYKVQWALLDAVNYRIPQNRERIFIVGFRKDLNATFAFPISICDKPITIEQAIGDITDVPNYIADGKKKDYDKKNKVNNRYPNHDVLVSKYGSFYYRGNRRRGWQQPSFTINATADYIPLHPSSPKMLFYGRENWNFQKDKIDKYRRLSVRECARIQTFSDDFVFEYDNIRDAYKMIGNAVPPRLGYVIAKSISNAIDGNGQMYKIHDQCGKEYNEIVLVGYCKGEEHKHLILKNRIYYVRSDGRKGSIFKDECSIVPQYLLLHYKEESEIYELEAEEPILVDASYLKKLGFATSGKTYLCFQLKSAERRLICDIVDQSARVCYDTSKYAPYFATIKDIVMIN